VTIAAALDVYIATLAREPFDWASNNCGDFIVGWVRAATGRTLTGLHDISQRAVARAVESQGGMVALVTKRLKCSPVQPAFAEVGDIMLFDVGLSGALCICNGRNAVGRDVHGAFGFLPVEEATNAWRLREVSA